MFSHYDSTFKSNRKLCLSILKQFGFGQRVMETRILMEVEEMIKKVREKQGRPFDVRQLTTSCVANVMMSMMFGRRFDHSDPAFKQLVSDNHDGGTNFSMALELFPALRILPYFKKLIAKELSIVKSVMSFIDNNVVACSQVCNNSLNSASLYCFMKPVGPHGLPSLHFTYNRNLLQTIRRITRMWGDAQRDSRPAEYRWLRKFRNSISCPLLECRAVTLPI